MEHEKNNFTFLTEYFALILHFDPDSYREKILTFMRLLKYKLRTNSSVNKANLFISRSNQT